MSNEITISMDRKYDGRAMSSLSDRARAFVLAMLQQGVNPKAAPAAAAACGFHKNYGYELMRDESVLAALREESTKRLASGALVGVNVLLEIAQSPTHKDQFRAAKELAGINGFTAEQRIVVEHLNEDTKGQIRQIRAMAAELKLDPDQLIRSAGIIEAEFTEVEPIAIESQSQPAVDDSDW